MTDSLSIPVFDYRRHDVRREVSALRERLGIRGQIVSPAGRQLTMEVFGEPLSPNRVAARICDDVRSGGLEAVIDYTARLDKIQVDPARLRVESEKLAAAHREADREFLCAIRTVRQNLQTFQSALLNQDVALKIPHGGSLAQRYRPLQRVGLCIPGGAAVYPSTVLMTAVCAQVAGVQEIAVVVPPTRFGSENSDLLATCAELGIDEVYRVGGAQAVAALAYGVEGLPAVDMIAGPGNMFVALAKRHVFGEVAIDAIAGPSEVVVIADESTPVEFAAADMVAQAEHAPGACFLITTCEPLLQAIVGQIDQLLTALPRGAAARESLGEFGALVLVADEKMAAELTNAIAPEHLQIATRDAESRLEDFQNAGAIFLGTDTPVAIGDYVAGPSHVLPTGGTARFASGLSANDFLRSTSVIQYSAAAVAAVADEVGQIASREGLAGHRMSVEIRRQRATGGEQSP